MVFRIIYILFLISSLILGSQYFGSVSFRQLFAAIMMIYCLKETKGIWMDKSFKFFLLFSFFFGITSIFSGYLDEFIKVFIAYYLVAWVGLWATVITYKKNNVMDCIHTLVAIGVFDAVITIMQSFGNPIALAIGIVSVPEEVEQISASLVQGEFVSKAIMGIFGSVYNGYYLLVVSILSLLYIMKYKNIFRLAPFAICFIASFLCQQRSPFFINVLFLCYFLFKYLRHLKLSQKLILLVMTMLVSLFVLPRFIEFSEQNDMRYSTIGMDGTGREHIYQFAENYIGINLVTANIFDFRKILGYSPHMLLYNMMIYGGLLGFLCISVTLLIQLKKSVSTIWKPLSNKNAIKFLASGAFLAFTANSLTHNASIVTGDLLIWILWGVVFSSNRYVITKPLTERNL